MEIRAVAEGDLDRLWDLRDRAFGPSPGSLENRTRFAERTIRDGRILGCYDGGRLVASGRFFDLKQWWHGSALPMAGVAGVYVAPEYRGRGVGRRVMTALLELITDRGYPLSTLFPATAPPYRAVGYEHGGVNHTVTLQTEALRELAAGPVPLRQVEPDDAAKVVDTVARCNAMSRECGLVDWPEDDIRMAYNDPELFGYLADDGYLEYGWGGDNDEFQIHQLVAESEPTLRALAALVGSGSSVAKTVRARLSPRDPLLWLLRDRSAEDVRIRSWMLRIVDAPAAIAGRGFPAGVTAAATLSIDDPQCRVNTGTWRLTIAGGRGRLERVTDTADAGAAGEVVRLSARGLAALYAGLPMSTLRLAGLAAGGGGPGSGGADALEAAFAATPYMPDEF